MKIRNFIENNVGLMVFFGALLGFTVPGLTSIPSWLVLANVGCVVFFSCFGLSSWDLSSFSIFRLLSYYIVRFILLPIAAFFLLIVPLPALAPSITLLFSVPAGVSTPSFAGIFGGNVAVALILCLLTHLLCPFTIPLISYYTVGKVLEINTFALFSTLCYTVLLPIGIYVVVKQSGSISAKAKKYSRLISICLVSSLGIFAIGMQRNHFSANLSKVPYLTSVSTLAFLFLFLSVWYVMAKIDRRTRLSYTIASGFNNTALGIGLSILYFPPETTLFLVVCEIPWCLAPAIFARTLGKKSD